MRRYLFILMVMVIGCSKNAPVPADKPDSRQNGGFVWGEMPNQDKGRTEKADTYVKKVNPLFKNRFSNKDHSELFTRRNKNTYIVGSWEKDRDCLWNISKKIYNDPYKWRIIYEANKTIKNPDLIYPGQKLDIP
jgi:nucleoid-associated protein YgaU